jgi:hypothetical protein
MKAITKILLVCIFCSNVAFASEVYENNVFSINALVDEKEMAPPVVPLVMTLSAEGGFASNVNVQIQQYPQSLKAYLDLTLKQLKQMKWTVIEKKETNDFIEIEYEGRMQGKKLHWYARAFKKGNSVFLITATSLDSKWKTSSEKLKECVNSFELKEA